MSQRFTDAELAAEYWALEAVLAHGEGYMSGKALERTYDQQETSERFATLPHANHEEREEYRDLRTNSIVRKDYFYSPAD